MNIRTAKRLAILVGVVILVGISGFFFQRYQVNRLAQRELGKAELACQEGDFAKAETLFREHLRVFPEDQEIQIKYADAILKSSRSRPTQTEAAQIYSGILKRPGGSEDDRRSVRKSLIELKFEMGRLVSSTGREDGADVDLKILLATAKDQNDPHLQYLMGRCQEANESDKTAAKNAAEIYRKVVERTDAPDRIDAGERLARLLRDKLNQPEEEARAVVNKLVKDAPKDYRGYLARGRFLLDLAAHDSAQKAPASDASKDSKKARELAQKALSDAKKDFEMARELAKTEPDVYLEQARGALLAGRSGYDEARQILNDGLKNVATSKTKAIYTALADTELRAGNLNKAIEVLELGVKGSDRQADQADLRVRLADLLAKHGDTGKLLLQIEELKKAGCLSFVIQYFTACYYINSNQFLKARQILVTLQTAMNRFADVKFKSRINILLAQCYGELGEPEMRLNAILQARSANPQDVTARLSWINNLISQGDTAGAVTECRALVKEAPGVRSLLARLLIEQNQRRPEPQRNWSEVSELINQMDETGSGERAVLRAKLLFAQGDQTGAHDELEKAKARFPKSVEIRIAEASLAGFQGRVDEGLRLLDQAKAELGDQVDVRLERARLWALKKGPQVLEVLRDLSQGVEGFSKVDQKRLLNGLALELERQQDLEGASRVWTRLAVQDPANINLRLRLLDLALQNAKKDDIEKNIKEIEEIEGSEGLLGRYCQVRYLIWQAERAKDKDTRQAIQAQARGLLEDLVSRRGDWSVIPLASGELAEQELRQSDLKGEELRVKEESIINFFLQAIKLGQRRATIVRRTVQLLFKTGQGDRALELLSSIPVESQLAGEERQAAWFAVENRDFQHALQIARKRVQANPGDFEERIWLAEILLKSEQRAEAAKELRDAVNLSPSDPDRWVALVKFMVFTKQMAEAERVIKDAETKLPPSKAPLALALCCEKMGRAYDGIDNAEMKKWNGAERSWYEKAQAAEPADLSIKRRLTEFFLRTRQTDEAQKYLETIIRRQGGDAKNAETTAWANRELALVLASGTDRAQISKALAIFEPDGKPVPAGQEGKALERKNLRDPEDLRVLARVLDLQRTLVHRKRAIEILETLIDKNLATSEDRLTVAGLYETIGEWQKAQEKYRELNLRTRNVRDMDPFNQRPVYIARFANNLLLHCKPGDKQDLAEAQELVDELKQLQPAALGTLILQVEIYRIRNEVDQAVELIKAFVSNPRLAPKAIAAVGGLAEKIKQLPLAEQVFRRLADLPDPIQGKILLATFLGRQGRITEGLKICEPLWNSPNAASVGAACIEILFGSEGKARKVESADIDRVSSWFEQAITRAEKQHLPSTGLLTGLGNLREKQDRFSEAEILYHRAIEEGDRDGVSLNNLAWLLALSKDPKRIKEALDYANRAVALKPDYPGFLDTRGMVYLVGNQPKLALDDFERAVAIDPSSPSNQFHLAQAYLANGDKIRAKQSLDAAHDKGLEPSSLHALEQQNYQVVHDMLESP
jgi:tetratricopeptide (TPR) repeat protein